MVVRADEKVGHGYGEVVHGYEGVWVGGTDGGWADLSE